nr:MAG TPA: hypothetical protein [Caudoviricetes sp.]
MSNNDIKNAPNLLSASLLIIMRSRLYLSSSQYYLYHKCKWFVNI